MSSSQKVIRSTMETEESKDSGATAPPLTRPQVTATIAVATPGATIATATLGLSRTVSVPLSNNVSGGNSERNNGDIAYLQTFPPGYRFCPRDDELIIYYLHKKVYSMTLPRNKIMEVNLYNHNPEELAERYRRFGEKEWYFFTPRNKKYRNGSRPNRAAGDGYWKATGADKEVKHEGEVVGFRKALVFYLGRPPKGEKSNWIMHEFRVKDSPAPVRRGDSDDMMLDEWVLCKIYKKAEKGSLGTQPVEEQASMLVPHDDTAVQMATNEGAHLNTDANRINYPSYMQQQEPLPFAEHVPQYDNFSMFYVDQAQPQPLNGISADSGASSSQAKFETFDYSYHSDPMAEAIYAPPLDSSFPDYDLSILDYQHGHDTSWMEYSFEANTIYPADLKSSPFTNPPNHPHS